MKNRRHFRIIVITAMLSFAALTTAKIGYYKEYYQKHGTNCYKNPDAEPNGTSEGSSQFFNKGIRS